MTGDNNGRWAGSYSSPLDHDVYLACVKDVILMLRNHLSAAMGWWKRAVPGSQKPPCRHCNRHLRIDFKIRPWEVLYSKQHEQLHKV